MAAFDAFFLYIEGLCTRHRKIQSGRDLVATPPPPPFSSSTEKKTKTKKQKCETLKRAQSGKRNDPTSAEIEKVLNAGTTGGKMGNESIYICQTGISGVYLLVSRMSNHWKT